MRILTCLFLLIIAIGASAQRTVAIRCPRHGFIEGNYQSCPRCAAEAGSTSGGTGVINPGGTGAYNLGYGFGQWLMSGPSAEEQRQAELQRQEKQREAQRAAEELIRKKEQERQDTAYRLNSTLKLSGARKARDIENPVGDSDSFNRLGLKLGRPETKRKTASPGAAILPQGVRVESPSTASSATAVPEDLDGGFQSQGTGSPTFGIRGNTGTGANPSSGETRPQSNGSNQTAGDQANAATRQGAQVFDGTGAKRTQSPSVFKKSDNVLDLEHVTPGIAANAKFQEAKHRRDEYLSKEVAAEAKLAEVFNSKPPGTDANALKDLKLKVWNEWNDAQNKRRSEEAIIKIDFNLYVEEK